MTAIYNFLYLIFCIGYFPYLLIRRKWHALFSMRFGRFPVVLRHALEDTDNIWIHAVSVGEALSTAAILRQLKARFPSYHVVVSTVTQTGYQMARSIVDENATVLYAPLDFSGVVRRFIRVIRPRIYIAAETEIWPNLFHALDRAGTPIIQINGRLSQRSYKGYRMLGSLTKRVLSHVSAFCMQSEEDARRIKALGADPAKVEVVGNIKFDDLSTPVLLNRAQLGLDPSDLVIVAGSTHPGEEEILADIHKTLSETNPSVRLVLAPRHVDRTAEITQLLAKKGLRACRFSQIAGGTLSAEDVIVVDTIGHLRSIYGLADAVFVGKSLTVGGGHNIIEPAYFGKPVLVGPMMGNFQDIIDQFLCGEGVLQVRSPAELADQLTRLLSDPGGRERLGQNARHVIEQNRGATDRTVGYIAKILQDRKRG